MPDLPMTSLPADYSALAASAAAIARSDDDPDCAARHIARVRRIAALIIRQLDRAEAEAGSVELGEMAVTGPGES